MNSIKLDAINKDISELRQAKHKLLKIEQRLEDYEVMSIPLKHRFNEIQDELTAHINDKQELLNEP